MEADASDAAEPAKAVGATVTAIEPAPASVAQPRTRTSRKRPAEQVHVITLTDRRCIRFEPQWTTVRLGQSITWRSELETPITIHVSPGVFSRTDFRVRPGAIVNTGPALASGRYSFWTEPAACRDMPRGVLLAGPGVRVRETFYASTPGVR